jgi:2-methylcitrate dehydratase PrpD
MRHALGLALLLLFACSGAESVEERAAAAKSSENGIDCALAGAAGFERACIVEQGEGGSLTLRHPDGGFRRLTITDDGRGVVAADGAAAAQVRIVGDNRIEVAVGDDRYRLPATVRPGPSAGR